jgi:hypothetical protein
MSAYLADAKKLVKLYEKEADITRQINDIRRPYKDGGLDITLDNIVHELQEKQRRKESEGA